MRAVWSSSKASRWRAPSGIQSTAVNSCSERSARLLPSQSRTAVRSARPVSSEIARLTKLERPATRLRVQKKRSLSIQQGRFGPHLGFKRGGGNYRDLGYRALRRPAGPGIDQVVGLAPA